jgi:hypothetical protein
MTDKAYAVPLHELLAGVPRDTRLEITDPDGYGTRFIPVGRYCHEAAEALRAALTQPKKTDMQIGLTYEEANPSKHNFEFSTIEEVMQPMPTPTGQPQLTDDETRFANAFIALQKAGYGKEAEIVLKCKRKWVGLTDKEISEGIINSWVIGQAFESAVWWAEEKLKEKNT